MRTDLLLVRPPGGARTQVQAGEGGAPITVWGM